MPQRNNNIKKGLKIKKLTYQNLLKNIIKVVYLFLDDLMCDITNKMHKNIFVLTELY